MGRNHKLVMQDLNAAHQHAVTAKRKLLNIMDTPVGGNEAERAFRLQWRRWREAQSTINSPCFRPWVRGIPRDWDIDHERVKRWRKANGRAREAEARGERPRVYELRYLTLGAEYELNTGEVIFACATIGSNTIIDMETTRP